MSVVIAGCGALGTKVGLRLAAADHHVIGLRRSAIQLPDMIEGVSVDLRSERPDLPDDVDTVVVAMTSDEKTAAGYRATYVDGVQNLVDALPHAAIPSVKVVFVSSTSVYGNTNGDWVDETTLARPETSTAKVLFEAEECLRALLPQAVVLRLAGLYGPGRGRLVHQVRSGTTTLPRHLIYTNRIHIDDAASAVIHLTTRVRQPAQVYIGADNEPVGRRELVSFIAEELGVPRPQVGSSSSERGQGKRCRNDRLIATGFALEFRNYREGYRSILADQT